MSKRRKDADNKKEGEDEEDKAKADSKKAKAAKTKAKDGAPAPNEATDKIARRREALAMGLGEIQAKYYSPDVLQVMKTKVQEVGFSFLFSCFLHLHTMILGWVPSTQRAQAE